jgi:hypothetical protein
MKVSEINHFKRVQAAKGVTMYTAKSLQKCIKAVGV